MSNRLFYLDALRSFAMLFGLFVHAGTLGDRPMFDTFSVVSDHFRMAVFFVMSGYFSGLVVERRGIRTFFWLRGQALLVPLICGLVLLNPVTNWLVYLWHSGYVGFFAYLSGDRPFPPAGAQSWHLHLWFLVSLFVFVLTVPFLRSLLHRAKVKRELERIAGAGAWTMPVMAAIVVSIEIALRIVWRIAFEDLLSGTPAEWLPRATLTYWIYFAIGIAAFTYKPLFEALHRVSWPTFAAGLGLYGLLALVGATLPGPGATMLQIAAEETITTWSIGLLLVVFRRWLSAPSDWVLRLSDSVYTIYLFHYLLIYALALLFAPAIGNVDILFWVVAILAGLIGFVLHVGLIQKVTVLSYVFNGKFRLAGQVAPTTRT